MGCMHFDVTTTFLEVFRVSRSQYITCLVHHLSIDKVTTYLASASDV